MTDTPGRTACRCVAHALFGSSKQLATLQVASGGRRRRASCLRRGAHRTRCRGAVLPIVLLISAMLLATSAAWFEASVAAARSAVNVRDYLQAFHAADSALTLCARSVTAGTGIGALASPPVAREPTQWKVEATFEAAAATPVAQWPGALRAPQCVVEGWSLPARPDARAYLLTSRGFGMNKDSQVWLQMELVIDGDRIERHWRRVAARPF